MLTPRFDPEEITIVADQLASQFPHTGHDDRVSDLKDLHIPTQGYHWIDISDYSVLTINPKHFVSIGYALDDVILYTVTLNSQSPKTIIPVYDARYNEIHLIRENGSSVLVWAAKIPALKSIRLAYTFKKTNDSVDTALVPRKNFSKPLVLKHYEGGTHVLVKDCHLQVVSNLPVPYARKKNHQREGVYPSTTSLDDIRY